MGQFATNYYDKLLARLVDGGSQLPAAIEEVAGAYLDGKPSAPGKNRLTSRERDRLFWSSDVARVCAPESWNSEPMVLALARYFGQEPIAAEGLTTRVANEAPDALIRAVRYSGIVLNPQSPRRAELAHAAAESEEVAELCLVLDIFSRAHHESVAAVDVQKLLLEKLSVFELLIYASLYAFEVLVPRDFAAKSPTSPGDTDTDLAWDALSDLLIWKLKDATGVSLMLSDESIGRSIAQHLRPILFEARADGSGEACRNLRNFHALMDAQIELNEFISRSADAFCYDDGIAFERRGHRLEINEVDPSLRAAWQRDGQKLERLHSYWFHRALDEYVERVAANPALWTIGRPENSEANRLAWLRALQARLQLREAYGVADEVTSESGAAVDVFQALLSLNLMSVHFQQDFLVAFADRLGGSSDWIAALHRLALDGLLDGMQNRMPLTWSSRDSKVTNITGWTVTAAEPKGNPKMASAILDFWTNDMVAMADPCRRNERGLQPNLFERPILKFGATLVQLPWVVGLQNNSSAAINNLRRLGARRRQAMDETHRIEAELARLFESRGFRTLLNWSPPRDAVDAGEVDLIATLGQHLFVIEVKSTFLRRTQRDAWLHATTTLRKAGQQLRRKVEAVTKAVAFDPELRAALGRTSDSVQFIQHGWIVDTSIERDHQRFAGFLKVSVEELLIALRDDRHLLKSIDSLLEGKNGESHTSYKDSESCLSTLYPTGFSAERLIEVIETKAVWDLHEGTHVPPKHH